MAKVILDPGHGGTRDPGAVYEGRQEKDDVLRLALAVGEILEQNGVDVTYTRVNDVYDSPYEKAVMGNNSGADFFVSLHRNSNEVPNSASGIMTLVYQDEGIRAELARNINEELSKTGFQNLGVIPRPNLVVLRRTQMPSVLVEAGFINNEADNAKFDADFDAIARAIADGILTTIRNTGNGGEGIVIGENVQSSAYRSQEPQNRNNINLTADREDWDMMEEEGFIPQIFRVQTGAFRVYQNAARYVQKLQSEGFPAFLFYRDGLYLVQVGAYKTLQAAIRMERQLRKAGYNTFITSEV